MGAFQVKPYEEQVALQQGKRMEAIKNDTELLGDKSLYKDLIKKLGERSRFLVNLCPLTANIGGYLGPLDKGVFYSEFYLQVALRAGIRSFVLPISTYLDNNKFPPLWPYSGEPAIVSRNQQGTIISMNGISIRKFCDDLLRLLSVNPNQTTEPVLLFLIEDSNFTPNKVKEERQYAQLLSKMARDLSVIPNEMRLTTLGGHGSAVGTQNESTILTQIPLTELKSKILIFTSFDTKIGMKGAYSGMKPTLDDYTNFSIKPVIAQNSGIGVGTGARSIKLADISGSTVNWTDQSRTVMHTATQDFNLSIPNAGDVEGALTAGIQVIPVPFFSTETIASVKPIWDLWNGYAWRIKGTTAEGFNNYPMRTQREGFNSALYVQPEPIVPAKPSAKMNARVSPDMQPGQMAFQ